LVCSVTPDSATICSNSTQTFTVSATGGTAPYQYSWINGSTNSSITVSKAGTYSVTVTDAKGNTSTCSATLSLYASFNLNPCTPFSQPCGNSWGNQLSCPSGYASYSWTCSGNGWAINGGNNSSTCSYNAGWVGTPCTFTCTVVDNNGCKATCATTITCTPGNSWGSCGFGGNGYCNTYCNWNWCH
jgi:hypothetical protein